MPAPAEPREDLFVEVRDELVLPKALGIVLLGVHQALVRPQVDAEHVEHPRHGRRSASMHAEHAHQPRIRRCRRPRHGYRPRMAAPALSKPDFSRNSRTFAALCSGISRPSAWHTTSGATGGSYGSSTPVNILI